MRAKRALKILLIEPDKILADTYRAALKLDGHKVVMAASAQAAILAADEQKPDLVILELQLARHSGIEFLYEFRSYPDWQTTPVIVQSNLPMGELGSSWQLLKSRLAIRDYLYKPLTDLARLRRAAATA